jgi:primary-amine oxidase
VIAFKDAKWTVETFEKLPEGTQPQISVEELILCEAVVKKDPTVQKLAADVGS